MKTRNDIIQRMIELEKQLMHLSNDAQDNAELWDAILEAQLALHEAVYGKEAA